MAAVAPDPSLQARLETPQPETRLRSRRLPLECGSADRGQGLEDRSHSAMTPPVAENTAALDASAFEELRGLPARFRPEKLLGRGSQRSVYLAHDREADRRVAVSVFDTRALSPAEVERL